MRAAAPTPVRDHPRGGDPREADSRFDSWLLDSMSSGVLGVDASGAVVAMNLGARRILGCPGDPAAPAVGRDCRELLAAQPALLRLLLDALRRPRELWRVELPLAAGAQGGAS